MAEEGGGAARKVVDKSRTAPFLKNRDFDNLLYDGAGLEAQASQLMKSAQRSPERWVRPPVQTEKIKKKRNVAQENIEKAKRMLETEEDADGLGGEEGSGIDDIAAMRATVAETNKRSQELLAAQMQNAVMLRAKFDEERKIALAKKERHLAREELKRRKHEEYTSWKRRTHTKMRHACARGDVSMLQEMWDEVDRNVIIDLVNAVFSEDNGETCLLWAAENGRVGSIEWLLDHGANVYAKDAHGRSALSVACWKGHIGCAKWLCDEFNFRPRNSKTNYGDTPLHDAAYSGQLTLFMWLHKSGHCELEARNELHECPLHGAAASGNIEVIEYLLENLCDPGLLGYEKRNAAFYAAAGGHITTLEFLWKHCAAEIDFAASDANGIRILEVARTENSDSAQASKTVRYLRSILPEEALFAQTRQLMHDSKA